jgi:transmembrane sensor
MDEEKLKRLLHQYFNNTISPADCIELLEHISANAKSVAELLNSQQPLLNEGPEFGAIASENIFQQIMADPRLHAPSSALHGIQKKHLVVSLFQKFALTAAAVLVICASVALFKLGGAGVKSNNILALHKTNTIILPGSNKAILTLSNNKVIVLGANTTGLLARFGSVNVHNLHKDELVYKDSKADNIAAGSETLINTLTTPRGGQYEVMLEDGTKIWLNSASSISYPDKFTGNERHVKLQGEAYFEVAKNKEKPFFVDINNVKVRVLGTHFNISAYSNDDNITTTLLEGSVQISKNDKLALLKPGQQGVVFSNGSNIQVSNADVAQAVAWKNGYFVFNDESITDIMKKVSRWYDVDVSYKGDLKDQRFGGIYERSKGINDLLNYLGKIGSIHFDIEERRIIVMK